MKNNSIKGLPIEVAAACGYVPGFKLPWWKIWWNRLLLRISPTPPRVKVWTHKADLPPPSAHIWERGAQEAVIGCAEAQAKLFAHQIETGRVLAQNIEEASQYWLDYDAKGVEVVMPGTAKATGVVMLGTAIMSGTTIVAVVGTYVPHVVSGTVTSNPK